MSKKQVIVLILILAVFVTGLTLFYFSEHERLTLNKSDILGCIEKTNGFFTRINTQVDSSLDYSFAENDSVLVSILGSDYNYVNKKNNNCYAVVKNYNPLISEYRYSIFNADIEELNPVLLEHDLTSSSSALYIEDFLNSYNEFLAN